MIGDAIKDTTVVVPTPILEVRDLTKRFDIRKGFLGRVAHRVRAVDTVSFSLMKGGTVGIVGESGCGKSTTGRLITRLIEPSEGSVHLRGQEITKFTGSAVRMIRRDVQMVFQDPYNSLNPRLSVKDQIAFNLRAQGAPRSEWNGRIEKALAGVGLMPMHAARFPHQLSGGQRQRVSIARAIANDASVLIADEPVSALDKSVQAQVLNLLQDLRTEMGLSMVFISHDLNVVRYMSDIIAVMYLGKIVEMGPAEDVYKRSMHPYTRSLLASIPSTKPSERRLSTVLEGDLPSPLNIPTGCRFRTRCPLATTQCAEIEPALTDQGDNHMVACHNINAAI
ncbi:hypothetical protein AYO38_08335 [bacterium SCGC AG-212-C10]|nr:hypothetical protein AYO38_08335 [bacterium SCGC AG-212-C10]